MNSDVWEIFHDGSIVQAYGSLPGEVTLIVEILYLRNMFPGRGECFKMLLSDCTRLEYEEYDQPPVRNLSEIAKLEPEILSVESDASPLVVHCSAGTLRVTYRTERVFLDSGEPLSFEAFAQGSERYWKEWREQVSGRP